MIFMSGTLRVGGTRSRQIDHIIVNLRALPGVSTCRAFGCHGWGGSRGARVPDS